MINLLKKYCDEVQLVITNGQLEKFDIYFNRLIETNKVMNLTAITDPVEVCIKHFIDSIIISKYIELPDSSKVIDIGTGAGFPGIPLAIIFDNVDFTLVDSLNKRIKFLDDISEDLGLKNVSTRHGRFENLGQVKEFRAQYDFALSRAVAPLNVLLEYTIPFLKVNAKFISYKSVLADQELTEATNAMKLLKCSLSNQFSYRLPEINDERVLLEFLKNGSTEKKYPRKAGTPKRKPL